MTTPAKFKSPRPRNGAPADPPTSERPVTVPHFLEAKARRIPLTLLTAYDCTMARILDAAGVDALLVGDSLGMVVQGQEDCLAVTLEEMIYHTRLVMRGARRSLVITDMPFMSYQVSREQALANAGRLVKEGGAHAVKLEGGIRSAEAVRCIASADIPVMGHIGMTPQSVRRYGGFKVQRNDEAILADARAIEEAGAFALVVECVPAPLAEQITAALKIPTIGIGAGKGCDGQILVTHDLLGLFNEFQPRFVKRYADLAEAMRQAVATFCQEVRDGVFPGPEHSFR
jgi:3-methyl-2-oxobutanoate hydroxymethyltransferase